jgi:hypothetical protein
MVGAGIGLSLISKASAASKNSNINSNIQELEVICYYNNVARYFIENVEIDEEPVYSN